MLCSGWLFSHTAIVGVSVVLATDSGSPQPVMQSSALSINAASRGALLMCPLLSCETLAHRRQL